MKHNYVFINYYKTQNSYVGIGKSTFETTLDIQMQNQQGGYLIPHSSS